jgi:hypothetical protein
LKIKKFVCSVSLAAAFVAASTPAFAFIVFDPSNWVQNNSSAIAAVRNEINTAQALVQQIRSAIATAKSVSKLSDLSNIANIQQAMNLYNSLQNIDSQLGSTLQRNQALTQDLVSQYGASGMPWDQFIANQQKIRADERAATLARYDNINASLADTAAKRSQIVTQLGSVQGQTEALQTLGAALDVIIGQNQQIIMALKASSLTADNSALREAQYGANVKSSERAYQQRLRDDANK